MITGSVASAMRNIFQEYSEPLYGRVNRFIHVRPFPPSVLMEILKDHRANFSNTDLWHCIFSPAVFLGLWPN